MDISLDEQVSKERIVGAAKNNPSIAGSKIHNHAETEYCNQQADNSDEAVQIRLSDLISDSFCNIIHEFGIGILFILTKIFAMSVAKNLVTFISPLYRSSLYFTSTFGL